MTSTMEAPAGTWLSPLTSDMITRGEVGFEPPALAPDGEYVYWVESRPSEAGRLVLCRERVDAAAAAPEDVTPGQDMGFNVCSTVHEYGGGAFLVTADAVFFCNFKDQHVYRQALGESVGAPEALTSVTGHRFADFAEDAARGRLVAVREDHTAGGEAINTVAAICLKSGESTVLVSGADFYMAPRVSPEGGKLAWVQWMHPDMPWHSTELWVADLTESGSVKNHHRVAGGADISVAAPEWAPDGTLVYVSDDSGWWNLHITADPGRAPPQALAPRPAEFGGPAWELGWQPFRVLPDGRVLAIYADPAEAHGHLAVLDPASGTLEDVSAPYTSFGPFYGSLAVAARPGGRVAVAAVGNSPVQPSQMALLEAPLAELASAPASAWRVLRSSCSLQVDKGYLSEPRRIEFLTAGGATAHMHFYPPANRDFRAMPGELPPLRVHVHGGPTAEAGDELQLVHQYWTSRGFALASVNYRGSTGYGRAYRDALRGQWGIADVEDCCAAATFLAEQGLVDRKRMVIAGGSAGGFTTLACLAFRNVFAAGASHYGIADCELLAQDTGEGHKFECKDMHHLIGPDAKTLRQRSPINSLESFCSPVIIFQGLDDIVVPVEQATAIYDALKTRGIPTALVLFAGEGHGFRGATAIRRALDGELYFYGKVLGFHAEMPPDLEPIPIVNL